MDLDLDDFADAVTARASQWNNAGVRWELHREHTRDKPAAWIVCTTTDHEAQLTVWTSGEAELDLAHISTGTVISTTTKCPPPPTSPPASTISPTG